MMGDPRRIARFTTTCTLSSLPRCFRRRSGVMHHCANASPHKQASSAIVTTHDPLANFRRWPMKSRSASMAQAKQGRAALNLEQFFRPIDQTADLDFLLGAAPEAAAQRALDRDLPLLDLPIRAIAPDAQQIRRLPHPNDLVQMGAAGDRAAV